MLMRVHKVFICTCIAFCVFFSVVQIREYRAEGGTSSLVRAVLSALVGTGLLAYFVYLLRKRNSILP